MAYTALARRWRPRSFAQMTGQEHVLQALQNALTSGRVHHAYLFTGTRGVGKTTVARILAKCLNCEVGITATPCGECASCREIDEGRSVDVLEVDAASRTKVDDTRELLDNVPYAPTRSRFKIYLIDEVHMLSTHSFNALLKTLEEPPPHVKFLLATTDPQKLPVTVLSRCLQFNLKRLSVNLIASRLKFILDAEQIAYEPAALQLLAQAGDGSLRDALSLLDQLLAFGDGRAAEAEARAMLGTVERDQPERLAKLLAGGDPAALMAYAESLEQWSPDYAQLLAQLAALLERVALRQVVPGFEGDELFAPGLLAELAASLPAEDVQLYYQTAILGRRDLPLAPDPRSGFRMTLLRMIAFRPQGAGVAAGPPGAGGMARAGVRPDPAPAPTPGASSTTASAPVAVPTASQGDGTPDWNAVVAALDLTGPAKVLAAHCQLLEKRGTLLRLVLDPRGSVVRTRAQEDKLTQALSRHFGAAVRLEFTVQTPELQTPAQLEEQRLAQRAEQARASLATDPTVQLLHEQFGATPHPDSIRARD
ncbi:MAG TPA: DNA polymerase III subunit gamma/tau [Steroidobacteraceae bacterium]|nr:DNA polymerase III subunit gamma/tau [Steroidobacteraceae bacterium]